jgi:uncharacterized protein (TIGR03067 family)
MFRPLNCSSVLFIIVAFLTSVVLGGEPEVNVDEIQELNGTWETMSSTFEGHATPGEVGKLIRFSDGTIVLPWGDPVRSKSVPFQVDATRSPKRIWFTVRDEKSKDVWNYRGIFSLDGGSLVIAWRGTRDPRFPTWPTELKEGIVGHFVDVLSRRDPKEEGQDVTETE